MKCVWCETNFQLLSHLHESCPIFEYCELWTKDAEFREGLWCSLEHRRKCERVAVGGDVFVVHCGWRDACTYLRPCAFCCRTIQPMILDQNYIALKTQVIKAERRVLKELGFCVHVKHPHKVCYTGVTQIVHFGCAYSRLPICPYNNLLHFLIKLRHSEVICISLF
jgi:hypothetical protein